jgi:hypothetical protein
MLEVITLYRFYNFYFFRTFPCRRHDEGGGDGAVVVKVVMVVELKGGDEEMGSCGYRDDWRKCCCVCACL